MQCGNIGNLSPQARRQRYIHSIRESLKPSPLVSKNSLQIEAKEGRTRARRQSLIQADIIQSQRLQRKYSDQDEEEERSECNQFMEKYIEGQFIGSGANGYVRACFSRKTKCKFAVKCAKMDDEHILELRGNFKQIKALRSPNIIQYRALYFDLKKHVSYLIMAYSPLKNLLEVGEERELPLRNISERILFAIQLIHREHLCHRDIKPENILYDPEEGRVILIDFGISKLTHSRGVHRAMLTNIGTAFYLAPEVLLGGGYDERVDLWALGVTLFRMVEGRTPFESEYHLDTISNITRCDPTYSSKWQHYSPPFLQFIKGLICNRDIRFTVEEALSHQWIQEKGGWEVGGGWGGWGVGGTKERKRVGQEREVEKQMKYECTPEFSLQLYSCEDTQEKELDVESDNERNTEND